MSKLTGAIPWTAVRPVPIMPGVIELSGNTVGGLAHGVAAGASVKVRLAAISPKQTVKARRAFRREELERVLPNGTTPLDWLILRLRRRRRQNGSTRGKRHELRQVAAAGPGRWPGSTRGPSGWRRRLPGTAAGPVPGRRSPRSLRSPRGRGARGSAGPPGRVADVSPSPARRCSTGARGPADRRGAGPPRRGPGRRPLRSEEHTSELQSRVDLVCRL